MARDRKRTAQRRAQYIMKQMDATMETILSIAAEFNDVHPALADDFQQLAALLIYVQEAHCNLCERVWGMTRDSMYSTR